MDPLFTTPGVVYISGNEGSLGFYDYPAMSPNVIALGGSGATGSAEDRGSRVADELIVGLDELRHAWEGGLSRALGWEQR